MYENQWDLTEEDLYTAITRIDNLMCLYRLKDKGYDIYDYLFGYCGCGQCTNDAFYCSIAMVVFGLENDDMVHLTGYFDVDEWLEKQPYKNGIVVDELTDVIMEFIIYDPEADKAIANLVHHPNIIHITAEMSTDGRRYWRIAVIGWETEPDDFADICVQIDRLKGARL